MSSPSIIRFWGTRGSIPSPGSSTAYYGGNTPCVEVLMGGERIILDCGSGIRRLGRELADVGEPVEATILLTHFHWDHIQGFPFFHPLYDKRTVLRIVGPRQGDTDVETLFAGQMAPIYFPVPFARIAARCEFRHLESEPVVLGGVRIRAIRVCHPSRTVGYRMDRDGCSVAYIPDNELQGDMGWRAKDWRGELLEFLDGVDILIHDAMYTETEYGYKQGWGHSTYRQALTLAQEAGVGHLVFFHHDPDRSDVELRGIVDRAREHTERHGIEVEVSAAQEGTELRF